MLFAKTTDVESARVTREKWEDNSILDCGSWYETLPHHYDHLPTLKLCNEDTIYST